MFELNLLENLKNYAKKLFFSISMTLKFNVHYYFIIGSKKLIWLPKTM